MKKVFLLLSLTLILALLIAGCTSAQQGGTGPQEETPAAQGGFATQERQAGAAAPTSEVVGGGGLATQEPEAGAAAPTSEMAESGGLATEEPQAGAAAPTSEMAESGGVATQEPQAGVAETPAAEAQATTQPEQGEVLAPTGAVNINRLSNLLDFEVWNTNNEQIGQVDAMIINQDTSQIEYMVIGTGGFLGLGQKEIPVPWQAMQIKTANANTMSESNSQGAAQATTEAYQGAQPTTEASQGAVQATTEASQGAAQVTTEASQGAAQAPTEAPQNVFILDATKEKLEQAPDIDLSSVYAQNVENQAQGTETPSFQEREQEIQSFWQSEMSLSNAQGAAPQATTEAAQGAQPTTEASQGAAQETTATGGTKNLILADDLLGATLTSEIGEAMNQSAATAEPNMSGQAAGTAEPLVNPEASNAQDLGEVQEVLVDVNTGKVTYLLVSLNDNAAASSAQQPAVGATAESGVSATEEPGMSGTAEPSVDNSPQAAGNQLVPVPLQAVKWDAEEKVLYYTGSQSLDQAPTISEDALENELSPSWQSEADSFWGVSASNSSQ